MNHDLVNLINMFARVRLVLTSCLFLFFIESSVASDDVTPLGLPSRPVEPSYTAEQVRIGKAIFESKVFSISGDVSCASCHDPQRAFSKNQAVGIGFSDRRGTRNAPSLLNVSYAKSLFWDGRVSSVERQATLPFTNSVEHGLASISELLRLARRRFHKAMTRSDLAQSIAAYESTLMSGNSAFDRFYYGKEPDALTQTAQRGLSLFIGRAKCASCHTLGSEGALFSDQDFHPSSTTLPPTVTNNLAALVQKLRGAKQKGDDAVDLLVSTDNRIAALGRFSATLQTKDIGLFKTPSLRNVSMTAPYMHDGSVDTLSDAVQMETYGRGESVSYPIVLTQGERDDLVDFLKSLDSN